jgi:hypothetical protein
MKKWPDPIDLNFSRDRVCLLGAIVLGAILSATILFALIAVAAFLEAFSG